MITACRATELRELYALGIKQRELAARYHINQSTVSKIVHGALHAAAAGPCVPTKPGRQCCDCRAPIEGKAKRCAMCRQASKREYNQAYYQSRLAAPKRRYGTQAHYDTYEGEIDGYQIVDRLTGDVSGLYSQRRA